MNAYELADKIDQYWKTWQQNVPIFTDAANMLRQQADRIAELKKNIGWNEKELRNACRCADLENDAFLRIKAYLPVHTTPQTKDKE